MTFWITGAGVDLMPVAFVGIFIPYGCGADGAEILEGADGAGGVNDMPADLAGGGAPMPDRDGGGAEAFIGAGGAPMPDKDFGGVAVFAGAGGEPIPDSDIGGDDFAGAAGAAGPRLLVAGVAAFAGVAFAAALDGVELFALGEDLEAACPLSLAPPPEEDVFDGVELLVAIITPFCRARDPLPPCQHHEPDRHA